jgi:DNA-binding transcriptional ArsR family regulator
MAEWTFLTNHAVVLSLLAKHPRITALELASAVGITERAVRRVIADLAAGGYIVKEKEGRGTRYWINPHLPLRHAAHREVAVAGFLKALGWKKGKEVKSPKPARSQCRKKDGRT